MPRVLNTSEVATVTYLRAVDLAVASTSQQVALAPDLFGRAIYTGYLIKKARTLGSQMHLVPHSPPREHTNQS